MSVYWGTVEVTGTMGNSGKVWLSIVNCRFCGGKDWCLQKIRQYFLSAPPLFFDRMKRIPVERIRKNLCQSKGFRLNSSGRLDSNQRPPTPEAGALTGLRYTPNNCP